MNTTKPKANTVITALFGNALEWYDFVLYANFAPIIATLFFPSKNPFLSLLLTFVVFATGFFVRPLGALVFGYLGDHIGRRKALIFSIFCITIPTFLIGFLPTYQHIGILAPLLLMVLRLAQGLAVSGELNTATSYLLEHVMNRRGVAGSLIMGTAFLGMLIGGIISTFITVVCTQETLHHIGWRIPFWIGGALGIVGIIIRLRSMESPKFLQEKSVARISALIPTVIAELFPTRVRNTGTTVGYNIALALLGGTTPIIALALVKITQNTLIPAVLTIFFAILALILLRFIKESYQESLL